MNSRTGCIHTSVTPGCILTLVRRINIHVDAELDADLTAEAARTGESKAALLRRAARSMLGDRIEHADAGWGSFTGAVTESPADDLPDDDVIYGP